MQNKLPIYGFMHCCAINDYKEIINDQISKITISGLYPACRRISIGLLGEYDKEFWKDLPNKFHIDYQSSNIKEYEFPTLNLLHKRCLKENCLVWYIHTKGVANRRSKAVSWRESMEKYIITNWKNCVYVLNKFNKDTCGYGLSPKNQKIRCFHYDGNFWWAKSKYIKTIGSPMMVNLNDRWDAERWLLRKGNTGKEHHVGIEKYVNPK